MKNKGIFIKKTIHTLLSSLLVLTLLVSYVSASSSEGSIGVNAYEYEYRKVLNVPVYKQERNYWCGPASLQIIIKYVKDNYFSQSTLASKAETTSTDGTFVYKMAETLRYYGVNSYYYSVYNKNFDSTLRSSLNNGIPVIAHLRTRNLPAYKGKDYRHYVVIHGRYEYFYDPSMDPETIEELENMEIGISDLNSPQSTYINELYYTDPFDGVSGVYGKKTVSPNVMLEVERQPFFRQIHSEQNLPCEHPLCSHF